MKSRYPYLLVILITFLLEFTTGMLFGSNEIYTNVLRGEQIVQNKSVSIYAPSYTFSNWNTVSSQINLRFYLAEDRNIARNTNSIYTIQYCLILTKTDDQKDTITESMTVSYATSGRYSDLCFKKYPGYKSAVLKVLSPDIPMPEDIFLELQLKIERCAAQVTLPAPGFVENRNHIATNELLLVWDYLAGADSYDVEWLFIDDPSWTNNVKYDFRNATRINISENRYPVSLSYPKGTLLYRVRGVGTYYSEGKYYPLYGDWSEPVNSGNSIATVNGKYKYAGLETGLTWQYTAAYSEEGKRKEVITFFDGSLRNRQEVTVLNTDDAAVVSETFYDHVGRQALQSIPAPTPGKGIRYYGTNSTAQGLFNDVFTKSMYDADNTIGNGVPFSRFAGSAKYYSANNPFLNKGVNINQIPADSGYTYTHTRYLNDGTDRVHSQSNAGEGFQLGKGRETQYFYGNPAQVELDRLFGNEVGDASHYQKVLAVDANGVTAVSYYDMKERLIASAVASGGDHLLEIDNTPETPYLSNKIVFDEESRQYVQNITVDATTDYIFEYQFRPSNGLYDTCNTVGCIDCRYRVTLNLWNPDKQRYEIDTTVITNTPVLISCTKSLPPGSYLFYKNVEVVTDDVLEAQLTLYADRQRSCVTYTPAEKRECLSACEEYCREASNYQTCLDSCQNPPQNADTECQAKRRALLADMSPGGQYFDNRRTHCPPDSVGTLYHNADRNHFMDSIPGIYIVVRPLMQQFGLAEGNRIQVWDSLRAHWEASYAEVYLLPYHPEYHLYEYFCQCGNYTAQNEFDSIFFNTQDYATAAALGLFNPLQMPKNQHTGISYDRQKGYNNFPIGSLSDPFFFEDKPCCEQFGEELLTYLKERMNSYFEWGNGTEFVSVWYVIFNPDNLHLEMCPQYSAAFGMPEEICEAIHDIQWTVLPQWAEKYGSLENAQWKMFQSIYWYLKEEAQYNFLLNCTSIPSQYTSTFQWGQADWWSYLYPADGLEYCDNFLHPQPNCSNMPLTTGHWNNFQIRYLSNPSYGLNVNNVETLQNNALTVLYDDCCSQCEENANGWMRELEDYFSVYCTHLVDDPGKRDELKQKLIDLCRKGCDHCSQNKDFSIQQLIDLEEFKKILENDFSCKVEYEDYIRIIYQRSGENTADCGCNNYQDFLNSVDLTFWSNEFTIRDSLKAEGIPTGNISEWNRFCIWKRYDYILQQNNDPKELYDANFPEYFKCNEELSDIELCELLAKLEAEALNNSSMQTAIDSLQAVHRSRYPVHCLLDISDTLTVKWKSKEFLFTLYYYDQADNLVRTVPPEGVKPISNVDTLSMIVRYRRDIARYDTLQAGFVYPLHVMNSGYRYNTLNQIMQNYQPDHDTLSVTYYDILSRPVLSQQGKQKQSNQYSYTLYDLLGRVVEVGQVCNNQTIMTRENAADPVALNAFITQGSRTEVTKTFYDQALVNTLRQTNLRNRISAVSYQALYSNVALQYQSATHYSYDIHGNVKQLIQNYPDLELYGRQYVYLDYDYDLVSGHVNRVTYQGEGAERFIHRYRYDADNRLTQVMTDQWGESSVSERLEARYFYLPHALVTRVELGSKQVQGVDYAYTIQGWLKDMNGYRTDVSADLGQDGAVGTNGAFGKDASALMLQYYKTDYRPVKGSNFYNKVSSTSTDLYNGNISAISSNSYHTTPLLKSFRYDKLNRLKSMQTATLGSTQWTNLGDQYGTDYRYDYNGNLLSLRRKNQTGILMHDIVYSYSLHQNRLERISGTGIGATRYFYDAIGNLIKDESAGISVGWNSAGKVSYVNVPNRSLTFTYTALGHRSTKQVGSVKEWYIYDATGNVMCVYSKTDGMDNQYIVASNQAIYGSKRLGVYEGNVVLFRQDKSRASSEEGSVLELGKRRYELTDHLGNVLSVVSDRKVPFIDRGMVSYYIPEVISYTDYDPFGYPILTRSLNMSKYRYGFNGQEGDDEVYGQKLTYAFEYRMYNAILGRWLSVDPLSDKYPGWSPYNYCLNNPVKLVDPNGKAPWDPTNVKQARQYAKATGGVLKTWKASDGRVASVATKNREGVEIKAFNPTNDSWGQKIGKFFNSVANKITGGQYGTADNGQGKETRKGDGSNKQVDLSDFTGNMPEPLSEIGNPQETSSETESGDLGLFGLKKEPGTRGYFGVQYNKPDKTGAVGGNEYYFGTEDSNNLRKSIENDPNKKITRTIVIGDNTK